MRYRGHRGSEALFLASLSHVISSSLSSQCQTNTKPEAYLRRTVILNLISHSVTSSSSPLVSLTSHLVSMLLCSLLTTLAGIAVTHVSIVHGSFNWPWKLWLEQTGMHRFGRPDSVVQHSTSRTAFGQHSPQEKGRQIETCLSLQYKGSTTVCRRGCKEKRIFRTFCSFVVGPPGSSGPSDASVV